MKKILLAFLGAALIGSAAFAEPDSGSFLANGSAFSVGNFYVEGNAGFVFPFGMLQENYDTSAKQPGAVFGAGLGYNHGGWLFGINYFGDIWGKLEDNASHSWANARGHTFAFTLRRVLSNESISFLPSVLEIVPGASVGVDFFSYDNGPRFTADGASLYTDLSLALAFNMGSDIFVPYIQGNYSFVYNKNYTDGWFGVPHATVGLRTYLLSPLAPKAAALSLSVKNNVKFTPDDDGKDDVLTLKPVTNNVLGNKTESWTLEIADPNGKVVRTLSGKGKLPKKVLWDGLDDNGVLVKGETPYTFTLKAVPQAAVQAKLGGVSEVTAEPVTVNVGPIAVPAVTISSELMEGFTPDGDNKLDTLPVSIKPRVNLKSKSWKLIINDKNKETIKEISGQGQVPAGIVWDGSTISGEDIFSGEDYYITLIAEPVDSIAKKYALNEVPSNTLEIKSGILWETIIPDEKWKIVVNTIYFDPDAATFNTLTEEQIQSNKWTLDSIADQVKEKESFVELNIEIQGYANNVSNTEKENIEELIPLSQARADAIKEELAKRGLKISNLTSIGYGGANPMAKWEDRQHWWKNRRVEFVVTKKN